MGADNWAICPQCEKERKDLMEKQRKVFYESYGQLPKEEFIESMKARELEISEEEDLDYTLRENYEIFTDKDGLFYVSYGCYCNECEFQYEYKYEEQLLKE